MKRVLKALTAWCVVLILLLPTTLFVRAVDVPEQPNNGIPLVIIRIDESEEAIAAASLADPEHRYGNIARMNASRDHSVRCKGTVEIRLPDGYVSEYGSSQVPAGEVAIDYIRGRGNSTWNNTPKKAYKFKYNKKQDLLGMGSAKEWALLANYYDRTLIRNSLTNWVSEELGMKYTIQLVPVDVVMIGSESGQTYLGSYCLSELVEVNKARVNISDGQIMSLYYYWQDKDEPYSNIFTTTTSNTTFIFKDPEYETEHLSEEDRNRKTRTINYINELDALIMEEGPIDEERHNQIAQKMDMRSTADFWLIQEFSLNVDAYRTSSNYFYVKENGKLFWGPLWDFDLAWQSEMINKSAMQGFNNYTENAWLDKLRVDDPYFVDILKERWAVLNDILIDVTKEGGLLDYYYDVLLDSWNENFDIWAHANSSGGHMSMAKDFTAYMHGLSEGINYRREWFNQNIDYIGDAYHTVSYEVDGEIIHSFSVRHHSALDDTYPIPEKDGYLFEKWIEKEQEIDHYNYRVDRDVVFVPIFVPIKEITEPTALYFSTSEVWVSEYDAWFDAFSMIIYPSDSADIIENLVKWTSSDEQVASMQPDGTIAVRKAGDATITATLYNGVSNSFIMHVYNPNQTTPKKLKGIETQKSSYTLEVGDMGQITYSLLPKGPINTDVSVRFFVKDNSVVEVDENCGSMVALKEGKITVTLKAFENDNDDPSFVKTVEVIVKAKGTGNKTNPQKSSYSFIKGANQTYQIGQNYVATFAIDADYSLFKNGGKIYVDGKLLDSKNYTSKAGSIVLMLKNAYMNTLKEGKHSLKVVLNDTTEVETSFTVVKPKSSENEKSSNGGKYSPSPKTTEDRLLSLWFILGLLLIVGLGGIFAKRKVS